MNQPPSYSNRIVFSLGGSVFYKKDQGLNHEFLIAFLNFVRQLEEYKGAIVIGGGPLAREFIEEGRKLGLTEYENDMLAIWETRKNATLILHALKDLKIYPKILYNAEEASIAINQYNWLCSGGFFPGITTDAVAALIAESISASKIINISNTAYLYNKNPKLYKDAQKIHKAPIDEFIKVAMLNDNRKAGENFVFDIFALKIAKRSNIPIYFTDSNIDNIRKILNNLEHDGSLLLP